MTNEDAIPQPVAIVSYVSCQDQVDFPLRAFSSNRYLPIGGKPHHLSTGFLRDLSASNESSSFEDEWVVKCKLLHAPDNNSAKGGYRNQFTGRVQRSVQ